MNRLLLTTPRATPLARLSAVSTQLRPRAFQLRTMASIPKSMSGVIIEKTGGVDVLQYKTDLPVPQPKDGEILVKNEFLGINYIDTYFRSGLYPAPSFPYILGREASGTVVAKSGSTFDLAEGDRVVYMGTGAYAEYTAIPATHAGKIPAGVSSDIAAAAMLQGLTAITLVREAHPIKKGEWALVHAAAGGVGLWLVQLLKALGAHTIATASTEEKRELARKAGAEVLIDYTKENVVEKVLEATGGQGVNAVFDGVGKSTFDDSLAVVARKGTMISFGNASGAVPPVPLLKLSAKNVKLLRPTLFNYLGTREEFEHYTKELFDFITKDKIDVRIHKVYDLKDVAQAHSDIEGRKTTGKLLLKP